ncbi:hypothetical protein GBAR_LOCUS16999 [Geodia barretti]|uniref:Uncharacterized protein n=2 Tax=Geodia barretti TaxID=519541 RepID=A0AA35SH87_GEOBA|nr:hypothetical protein GBAR_LOCUS16999 [Geodia barretti]
MASLSLCEDSYRSWRELAISSYCEQLSLMQRLRHEVVLLHGKLGSREAEIETLKQQLEEAKREESVVELEFSNYRKHTQKLMCDTAVDKTEQWLDSLSSN